MLGIVGIGTFMIGLVVIILLPGPNSLFVLTVSAKTGKRAGFLAVLGILVGDTVLMVLTLLGAASVINTYTFLFDIMRFGGAAYLSWMGFQLIRAGVVRWHQQSMEESAYAKTRNNSQETRPKQFHLDIYRTRHQPNAFYRSLIISMMNPKAIFFFLSFFVQFVDPSYPYPILSFLLLGVIVSLLNGFYLVGLIFFGYQLAQIFKVHYRIAAVLNGAVGTMFFLYGLRLVMTSSLED